MTYTYRRGSNAVFEARWILLQEGFCVTRCDGPHSPPDLVAIRKGDYRMLMVRHSRLPVRDAHVASILYAEDLDWFRRFMFPGSIRFECWILAPPDGWKYYEVLPGGIRRIWPEWEKDHPRGNTEVLDEAGILGEPIKKRASPSQVDGIPRGVTGHA